MGRRIDEKTDRQKERRKDRKTGRQKERDRWMDGC